MATKIDLSGKKILVTGAGRGIGRDIAEKLYQNGASVHALSRTKCHLDDLKTKCPTINIISVDLENWQETRKAVEAIGPLDAVINNAGIMHYSRLLDSNPEDYERLWNTNVSAILNISQVVAKGMIETGKGGSIINISSSLSTTSAPNMSLYATTKAAVDRLTQSMALEWGLHGIRANTLNITLTGTDMTSAIIENKKALEPILDRIPLGRYLQVEDVTNVALFLLSDLSTMVTGENIMVDGGFRCT